MTLKIKATERISIIGSNLEEKLGFAKTLLRLHEIKEGRIEIDDMDISNIPLHVLWNKISIISPVSPIFDSTLRHNIDPSGIFNDFEIISSLTKAKLEGLYKKFNCNLDTLIGKGGHKISTVDKKLIVTARAILKGSKVIIVEESGNFDITTGTTSSHPYRLSDPKNLTRRNASVHNPHYRSEHLNSSQLYQSAHPQPG